MGGTSPRFRSSGYLSLQDLSALLEWISQCIVDILAMPDHLQATSLPLIVGYQHLVNSKQPFHNLTISCSGEQYEVCKMTVCNRAVAREQLLWTAEEFETDALAYDCLVKLTRKPRVKRSIVIPTDGGQRKWSFPLVPARRRVRTGYPYGQA